MSLFCTENTNLIFSHHNYEVGFIHAAILIMYKQHAQGESVSKHKYGSLVPVPKVASHNISHATSAAFAVYDGMCKFRSRTACSWSEMILHVALFFCIHMEVFPAFPSPQPSAFVSIIEGLYLKRGRE